MISSTRLCVSTACAAPSRIITSIKELDAHKGHNSSSLGQISKKLKEQLGQFEFTQSLRNLIETKFTVLLQQLTQIQDNYIQSITQFEQLEAINQFINQEFHLINEHKINIILDKLGDEQFLLPSTKKYSEYFKKIEFELNVQIEQLSGSKQDKEFIFLDIPEDYKKLSKLSIDKKKAKHLDGCIYLYIYNLQQDPMFIMTNVIAFDTQIWNIKLLNVQKEYVGVGIGMLERKIIESIGLIIPFEKLQQIGHGLYMNFNDKAVYNSLDEKNNGIEFGKDKGIKFDTGDIVRLEYQDDTLTFLNLESQQSYKVYVGTEPKFFVVWLDLSEVEIL